MTNDMPAARNEFFDPAAIIIKVDGDEEAIRVANGERGHILGRIELQIRRGHS